MSEPHVENATIAILQKQAVDYRAEIARIEIENERLKSALKIAFPIVKEAYWDHHTAFRLIGSGYNNKAQHLAGETWNGWSSKEFEEWCNKIEEMMLK